VFVADSQSRQLAENIESLQDLHANLADEGFDPRTIPLVMQYNKRDLPEGEISPIEELDETLNFRGVPYFAASAINGGGVFETLRSIASMVLSRLSAPAAKES
jgi:signal recognition particle receptor subunit beta